MYNLAIKIEKLGKMYRLYRRPMDKIFDAFGLNFWRKSYYQEFWALRDLDLEVAKGERLGIIGRNGAGKSTLLKVIAGNVAPSEGAIEVEGNVQALMELGTGFHPEFTGRQNIRATLAYQGYSQEQIDLKMIDIIDFAELDEFIDQPVRTYSAGMYARLAFSAATAIEPEILIIDEVLGAGDAYFTGKCIERMRKLTEDSGVTVLFVSHDLNSVQQLCDRIVWIERGKIQEDGSPLRVIKAYSAVVRKEEKIRLRARDLKVLKKQAVLLDRYEDVYHPLLFHLVCLDGKRPLGKNRIYCIKLIVDDEEICCIDVGSPMDNSCDQLTYIIDTSGYMDWGPPGKDKQGTYRDYIDSKSKYGHAPFEMSLPRSYVNNMKNLKLEITADIEDSFVAVELFDGKVYKQLGILEPGGYLEYKFNSAPNSALESCSSIQENVEEIKEEEKENTSDIISAHIEEDKELSHYGSGEIEITSVIMLDQDDRDSKIFEVGNSMKVVFDFVCKKEISNPVFVFCIYLADGKCASQWVSDLSTYRKTSTVIKNNARFVFYIDSLLLGRGSYVASAAIFKKLSKDGIEAESYHVLDRCIHFQIVQGLGDNIERGLCLQPFKVELQYD